MISYPEPGRRATGRPIIDRALLFALFSTSLAHTAPRTGTPHPSDTSYKLVWQDEFDAPFIKGSPLQVGCRLREHHPLEINGTHMIIGEVQRLQYPQTAQRHDGSLSLSDIGLVTVAGLDTYTQPDAGVRFAPADTTSPPRQL